MKKLILAVAYLLPLALSAQLKQSQDFTVSTGTPYAEVSGRNHEYFSDGQGNCILVKTYFQKVTIQHYDVAAMKEISRKEYTDFPPDSRTEKCLQSGNRLFYLYSAPNKSKTRTLYAREINTTTGTLLNQQVLFETKGPVEFVYASADGLTDIYEISTYFEVKKSFDESKILIHYKREPITKNDAANYEVFGFYAFDANLTPLWGSEKTMPYTEKLQNVISCTIGGNGSAYMFVFTNEAANPRYEFFMISQAADIQKSKLDIDAQTLFQDIKMTENSTGNIICTGYYNNSIDRKLYEQKPDLFYSLFLTNEWKYNTGTSKGIITQNVNGVARFKISTQGAMLGKHMHEFPIGLINQYESPEAVKKNDKKEVKEQAGIKDLLLFDVIENTDGSTLIIGEQKYMRTENTVKDLTPTSTSPSLNGRTTTTTTRLFYAKNIVVTKLNPSGEVLWEIKLPKNQLSYIGMGVIGFKHIEANGTHYFMFLDNMDVTQLAENGEAPLFEVADGGLLFAYKVDDASGKYTNTYILDTRNVNENKLNKLPTVRIFDTDKKTFLIEFEVKGKLDNMVKMKLK